MPRPKLLLVTVDFFLSLISQQFNTFRKRDFSAVILCKNEVVVFIHLFILFISLPD